MRIGVPKEIKNHEDRVAITPAGAMALINAGHEVIVQSNAGLGSGFEDHEYITVGAQVLEEVASVWSCEMIIKVKEPLKEEYPFLRKDLLLFTYLHLAANKELTQELIDKEVAAVAYESISLPDGSLPLLTPMSEVAGRMATQIGAQFLQKTNGGSGILLAGVPGVEKGKVTVIGGGISGMNAAKMAVGLGANVTILDVNPARLVELDNMFGDSVQTLISNPYTIEESVVDADLVIGAVLIPGRKAPRLVTTEMVQSMREGSVIVDIAIDQGGIFETTSEVGTHDHPTYVKHGVVHYAVANMPGAVPRTSTFALTNSTLQYVLELANKGVVTAAKENTAIFKGIATMNGMLTSREVAEDQNRKYVSLAEILS